jgi:hypothetical protein
MHFKAEQDFQSASGYTPRLGMLLEIMNTVVSVWWAEIGYPEIGVL